MDLKLPFATVLMLGACSPHAFSPPGRTLPLETAAAVGAGNTAVQLEGGISAEVLGPGVVHATARVRHGVGEHTDLNIEGNFVYFVDGDPQIEMHRGIYSGRLGVKHAFGQHFALTGGVGAGGSAAGGFVSPDLGFIAGFENPYVVPFFSGRMVLSQPLGAREVEFVDDGVATDAARHPKVARSEPIGFCPGASEVRSEQIASATHRACASRLLPVRRPRQNHPRTG